MHVGEADHALLFLNQNVSVERHGEVDGRCGGGRQCSVVLYIAVLIAVLLEDRRCHGRVIIG